MNKVVPLTDEGRLQLLPPARLSGLIGGLLGFCGVFRSI